MADLESTSTRELAKKFLLPLLDAGADVIVLGCTHYAFLSVLLKDIAGPDVTILDSAVPVARELVRRLNGASPAVQSNKDCTEIFYTSASLEQAQAVISRLWGKMVPVQHLPDIHESPLPNLQTGTG